MGKEHKLFDAKDSKSLDSWFRRILQNPRKILGMCIKEGMNVMDFGCGNGYFTLEIANLVGEKGKVFAVDLQEEMLNQLRNKIKKSRLKDRIKLHRCEADRIGLKEKFDLIIAFYVLHEVKNQDNFFEEASRIMKNQAKLFISEPSFNVSKKEFEKEIKIAESKNFRIEKKPKIFLSRSIVLEKI
jgi:ubiquinone/menaquinone biosynthesis C-methylase UbiE